MARTLRVEQRELLSRAAELEAPLPGPPSENPRPPCALPSADRAARQLAFSADNMRNYFAAGDRQRRQLARSLRNAAKAYGRIDEESAEALNGGHSAAMSTSEQPDADPGPLALGETRVVASCDEPDFQDLLSAAHEIGQPDQAASVAVFADAWLQYRQTLSYELSRFRPFQFWEGEAAATAEASMDAQRKWLIDMLELCDALVRQAEYVVKLHKWAVWDHPTESQVRRLKQDFVQYPKDRKHVMNVYQAWQKKSEDIRREYRKMIPPAINPPRPPDAVRIGEPAPKGLIPDALMPGGNAANGTPRLPMMPASGMGGSPKMPDVAALTRALRGSPSAPEQAMSPASVGGAGGTGAGPEGSPAMPLMPPGRNGAAPMMPAGLADAVSAVPAGGASGTSGTMGGGIPMGAAGQGMGAAGQGKGATKASGGTGEERSLYVEDRAWTEGVIGNRRRGSSPTGGCAA